MYPIVYVENRCFFLKRNTLVRKIGLYLVKMLWSEGQKALVRKQSVLKFKQQNADLVTYSVEDLRERIPAIAFINPFATRLVCTNNYCTCCIIVNRAQK